MAGVVREDYLVCTEIDANHNRFFHLQELDDRSVRARWGRVGISEDTKTWAFDLQTKAAKEYDRKLKSKLRPTSNRDSYTKVDILTAAHPVPLSSGVNLADVATAEVDVDSETTRDLIRWLSEVNVHNILSGTTMSYNAATGLFATPLGVVNKPMVDRARILLNEMTPYVQAKAYDDFELRRRANEYLRLIPQDLGGTQYKIRLAAIFNDASLQQQADILDSLEASIASILTSPASTPKMEEKRTFDCKVHEVRDDQQVAAVKELYNGTRQQRHTSYSYQFKRLYSVSLPAAVAAWEADGAKLDNRMRLWHGTKPPNVLSILKGGLIVPTTAAHGRMWGDGVYYSDQSSKSLNYSVGYHAGEQAMDRVFMFLADVGLGNMYRPRSTADGPFPKPNHDSVFAEGGKAGLLNNEYIVYRVSQGNLVYLVEFGR